MILSDIKVETIKQLSDNFTYVVYSNSLKKALVIDPADSIPIIKFLKKNTLQLEGLLITHHHSDHTSGIKDLIKYKNVDVFSPNLSITKTTKLIKDQGKIDFDFIDFNIISTPGHTLDHIVYHCKKNNLCTYYNTRLPDFLDERYTS